MLSSWLQQGLEAVVPMLILLGLLIFVHELGHFLVAKYYKVRVEVFSLGFGPKLLSYKSGETVYAISAIPLGGYVKMFGDDPTGDVPEQQKQGSFSHKPVGQRIAIVLAGPLMNFFFAIVVFAGVALIGEPALSPKLGDVAEDSKAFAAGFRSGDEIKTVDGQVVTSWDQVQSLVENSGGKTLTFSVVREGTGETAELSAESVLGPNKNILSWAREVGSIEGFEYGSRASIIGVSDQTSLAAQAGLKAGDVIIQIDAVKIERWREIGRSIMSEGKDGELVFQVERRELGKAFDPSQEVKPTEVKVKLPADWFAGVSDAQAAVTKFGMEYPETYLLAFGAKSPAEKAGLQAGDKITAIDGIPVTKFEEVAKLVRSHGTRTSTASNKEATASAEGAGPLKVAVLRNGQSLDFSVEPTVRERMNQHGREEERFEIGIMPMALSAAPATFRSSVSNPWSAVVRGWNQTLKWTNLTVLSFVRLFQREVSAKNIGGFISIGQMAKKSWQIGASQFLNIMAIISINLFILNLLPVPVLDGGHLVFFTIEAIRGAPLSVRMLEMAQQVGLVLLLSLMAFALFNDFSRLLVPN